MPKALLTRHWNLAVDDSYDMEQYIADESLMNAERVLALTPEMLPVLKQAGVVDSGGQGLIAGAERCARMHSLAKRLIIQLKTAPACIRCCKNFCTDRG